jgi:hypothetical protein
MCKNLSVLDIRHFGWHDLTVNTFLGHPVGLPSCWTPTGCVKQWRTLLQEGCTQNSNVAADSVSLVFEAVWRFLPGQAVFLHVCMRSKRNEPLT